MGENNSTQTAFEESQMLYLAETDFKIAIINMSKETKENMYKELKESMMTISYQIENNNIFIIKKEPNGNSGFAKYN